MYSPDALQTQTHEPAASHPAEYVGRHRGVDPLDDLPERRLEGWYREVTLTGDRPPVMSREEVAKKWRHDHGALVAIYRLPGRDRPISDGTNPEPYGVRDLYVFDRRTQERPDAGFKVASQQVLAEVAVQSKGLRGVWDKVKRDIHTIREGSRLRVGTGYGRWLPKFLQQQEKAFKTASRSHDKRKVISNEQTLFYVADDGELHARCEGYNPDVLVAHPNAQEQRHEDKTNVYEAILAGRVAMSQTHRTRFMSELQTTVVDPARDVTRQAVHSR